MSSKQHPGWYQEIARYCIVATALSILLTQFVHAHHEKSTDPEEPCYEEVYFDSNRSSAGGTPAFFKHIWGTSTQYPYYRYLGAGYIGAAGNAYEDSFNGMRKWGLNDGSHYHSIISLKYHGTFGEGVSITFNSQDPIAFFFIPRKPETKHFLEENPIPYLTANQLGLMSAVTTVEGRIEYINGGGRTFVYESRKRRSPRQVRLNHEWKGTFRLRTLHRQQSRIQVAGKSHTETRKCRYGYSPLAATNHDEFNAFIKGELQRWVDNPSEHSFVKFGSMPANNMGDFALTTALGRLRIEFPRSADDRRVSFTRTSRCTDRNGFQTDGTLPYFYGEVKIAGESFSLPTRRAGCGWNLSEAKSILSSHFKKQDFATLTGPYTKSASPVRFIKNKDVYDIYVRRGLLGK